MSAWSSHSTWGRPRPTSMLPPGISGPAERLYGEGKWFDGAGGSRLELPTEAAVVLRRVRTLITT